MDDARLANLMFLVGLGSLAMPGCTGDGEPGITSGGGAPGNPLASENSLAGGDARDACASYIAKLIECGGGYDDDDYYGSGGYYGVSVAPGYAGYCDQYLAQLETYGAGCVRATVDYYSCLSGLSCQALSGGETVCGSALLAAATACGGGDGGEDNGE